MKESAEPDLPTSLAALARENDVAGDAIGWALDSVNPAPSAHKAKDDAGGDFDRAITCHWQESFERLPIIAIGLDRHGDVRYANGYFYHLTGFSPEEVIGFHWFERFLPVGEQRDIRSVFEGVLEHDFHPSVDNAIVDSRGREHLVHWFNARLRAPDDRVAGTFSLGQVITDTQLGAGQAHIAAELRQALSAASALHGLLPMCASCKKIREDDGYWADVAEYITKHARVDVTHGLCPQCVAQLYGDLGTP